MAKRVAAGPIREAGASNCMLDRALHDRDVHVVASFLAARLVSPSVSLEEKPLPSPVARRIRVLASDRFRQHDAAKAGGKIVLMDDSCAADLRANAR
jgi:hypothetical protein